MYDLIKNAITDIDQEYIEEASLCLPEKFEGTSRQITINAEDLIEMKKEVKKTNCLARIAAVAAAFMCVAVVSVFLVINNNKVQVLDDNKSDLSQSETSFDKSKFKNLDLESTVVIEDKPLSGTWKSIYFDSIRFTDATCSYIEKMAKSFNNSEINKDELLYRIRLNGAFYGPDAGESEEILQKNMTVENYPKSLSVRYKDENIYIDGFSVLGGTEMYNPKTLKQALGVTCNSTFSWRPELSENYLGFDNVDYDSDTEYCFLNGEKVAIKDAVSYSVEAINNGNLNGVLPDIFKVEPISAEVMRFKDTENECLQITYQLVLDGISVEGGRVTGIGNLSGFANGNTGKGVLEYPVYACMLTKNSVDWLRIAPVDLKKDWYQISDFAVSVSYDKACEILSEALSDEIVFKVDEARLMYAISDNSEDGVNTDSYEIRPKWRFHLTDVKSLEFRELYVYINADDGLYSICKTY